MSTSRSRQIARNAPARAEQGGADALTHRQHPFPGNALYRLAAAHVAATGVFFRLEPDERHPGQPAAGTT